MRKIALHNLGCKVNSCEADEMARRFLAAGYQIVDFGEAADICIVNTCTVTNTADKKSRQMLHRARSKNPDAIIVAAGCYADVSAEEILRDGTADLIVTNKDKPRILELVREAEAKKWPESPGRSAVRTDMEKNGAGEGLLRTRAILKIEDGCDMFCSYCIIPHARGRVRSEPLSKIKENAGKIAAAGRREAVITGINISAYGRDLRDGTTLLDVIRAVADTDGIERIRFGSIDPAMVTKELVRQLSQLGKVCPHFHLSLQSGCDETLKRMNRHYTTGEFEEKCDMLREHFDDPALTADIITGFPGETDDEFKMTESFIRRIGFADLHVFKYSVRKGTKAASMPGQVSPSVKACRSERLIDAGREMSLDFKRRRLSGTGEVLFEEKIRIGDDEYFIGYSGEYIKTAVKAEGAGELKNTIRQVRFCGMSDDQMMLAIL